MKDSNKREIGATYYDEIYADSLPFTNMNITFKASQKYRVQKVLQIYTPKHDDVMVDLGCGWGTFCIVFAPLCKEITGLDFSKKSIALCKRLIKNYGYKNVKFVWADAQHTGLKSGAYDAIVSADLFEHLYPQQSERVLDECRRLLRKGGKLIIWTPDPGHIFEILKNNNILLKKNAAHVDYKTMGRLISELTKRHFIIKKSYYTESHVPIFRTLERALMILPIMRRRIAILAEKTD